MVTSIHDELFDPEVIADPYPYLKHLQAEDPIHWNEKYDVWIITRYDDLVWITRHDDLFSSEVAKRDGRAPAPPIAAADQQPYDEARAFQAEQFGQRDQTEHLVMRKVVHKYFTPKALVPWRPRIQAAVAALLDTIHDQGRIDIRQDFAVPLDLTIMSEMMALPAEDQPHLRQMTNKLCALRGQEPNRARIFTEGIKDFKDYLSPLVEERLANPGDDLISLLGSGEQAGVYTREQVLANASVLLLAGQETTANLICNGALTFIRHPDQWASFKRNPSQQAVTRAIEECLRYDAPQKSLERIAATDVDMRGKTIRQGDRVRCFISSANRDPEVFEAPDTFDITRHPNRHVAFGSGVHHCLGTTLAQIEGQEALRALAERYSDLSLDTDKLDYVPNLTTRSLTRLPVSWV